MKSLFVLLCLSTTLCGQTTVPFTDGQWKFETNDYVLEEYLGKQSVLLKKNRATLSGVSFENGIIEYDMAFPEGRAFIGVNFRMQDGGNGEEFYFRSHQSGNPDANQYSPVYDSLASWQLYYGEEYSTSVQYAFNEWMHVKLLISGKYMEIYLRDMEKPLLSAELKRPAQKGYIGVYNFVNDSHFANFTYTVSDKVELKGTPKRQPMPNGTVTQWQISDTFSEKSLAAVTTLKSFDKVAGWKNAGVEPSGVLNLASIVNWSQEKNTVFARIVINSDKEQVKKIVFGFSDRVRVYLNDIILFSGEDNYRSRDYRFLGTIGYFDAVYLPLKKGVNEVRFAVSENFGGWGIQAKFEDNGGITFVK